jgi:hypothetical protein
MSSVPLPELVRAFNVLTRPRRAPSGLVPNNWHISIRRVPLEPQGHLVFLVNPESHFINAQGPIEREMGKALGQLIDLESEAATLAIVRLIIQSFIEGGMGQPWSWATNDESFGRRVVGVMRGLGLDEALLNMPVASAQENTSCREDWEGFLKELSSHHRGNNV